MSNTLEIQKISSSVFNTLEISYEIENLVINKLKWDEPINIPAWIKKIHIKCVKTDEKTGYGRELEAIHKNKHAKISIYIFCYDASIKTFKTLMRHLKIPFDCKVYFGGLFEGNNIFEFLNEDEYIEHPK